MDLSPVTVVSCEDRRSVRGGRACGHQHIGIFSGNVRKLSFQIRLCFLLSSRKMLSNPGTMEVCLVEKLKLCCNLRKKMPESPLSESRVPYPSLYSTLADLGLQEGPAASGDVMWEGVWDAEEGPEGAGLLLWPLPTSHPNRAAPGTPNFNSCESPVPSLRASCS